MVRSAAVLVVALALVLVGCGSGSGSDTEGSAEPSPPAEAARFRLTDVPDDDELTHAGAGTTFVAWGSDSEGSDEPVLFLAESPGASPAFVVSATGYEEYQSGLDQATSNSTGRDRRLRVEGRAAIYTEAGEDPDGQPLDPEIVVDRGRDRAVRVSAPRATAEELLAVAERVRLEPGPEGTSFPVVDDPPDGLAVTSEAGVDLVVALRSSLAPDREELSPGTSRSLAVGYERRGVGDQAALLAISVPGSAAALAAARRVRTFARVSFEDVQVAGREGFVRTSVFGNGSDERRLITTAGDGGLLVVASQPALPPGELVAVAEGVEEVSDEAWEAQVIEAQGGPELRPDEGGVELARGEVDGAEWLLQAVPPADLEGIEEPFFTIGTGALAVDPCLKLEGGRRACFGGMSGREFIIEYLGRSEDGEPAFVTGAVSSEVTAVIVATAGGPVRVETLPIPGDTARAFALVEQEGDVTEVVLADGSVRPADGP